MEAVEKVQRRKRKKELEDQEEGGLPESDIAIKCKSKRLHRSSSTVEDDSVILSTERQEQMLDTVSGHIRELTVKEEHVDRGDSNETSEVTMAGSKSRKTKKRQHKLDGNGEKRNTLAEGVTGSPALGESMAVDVTSSGVSQESALEYLRLWKEERERWSFKKKTQYWLLQNMYDRTKIPKFEFRIMLCYLDGLQGHQRELSRQRAQKIVDQYGEEGSSTSRRHYKRAIAIMRVLG